MQIPQLPNTLVLKVTWFLFYVDSLTNLFWSMLRVGCFFTVAGPTDKVLGVLTEFQTPYTGVG